MTALPPYDPDPLRPAATDVVYDPEIGAWVPRPSMLWTLLVGLVIGTVFGAVFVLAVVHPANAASRSGPLPLPGEDAGRSGVPPSRVMMVTDPGVATTPSGPESSGDTPRPSAGEPIPPSAATKVRVGIAAYAARSHGPRYLAIPEGPGVAVTICRGDHCIHRTSNDAGPDLQRQRAGRVADLSYVDFARLCGCTPELVGTMRVRILYGGPAPTTPPTDTP